MTARTKGIVVAALQIAIVCSLGAKLLADRLTRQRVWAEVAPYDPNLPIRGRYVRLQLKAEPRGFEEPSGPVGLSWGWGVLSVEDGRLVVTRSQDGVGLQVQVRKENFRLVAVLSTPVAYFIPEHAVDPSSRPGLLAEVTVPRKGPPRPIRLGVREGDRIAPLDL